MINMYFYLKKVVCSTILWGKTVSNVLIKIGYKKWLNNIFDDIVHFTEYSDHT